MFDIVGHNIDILIDRISEKFNIKRSKVAKLKKCNKSNLEVGLIKTRLYRDIDNNKYAILFSDNIEKNNIYFALKFIN